MISKFFHALSRVRTSYIFQINLQMIYIVNEYLRFSAFIIQILKKLKCLNSPPLKMLYL